MKDIKKLAVQTLWYGLPTILTRFIGLTLSIIVLRLYPRELTGDFQLIYVIIPILMILYTYGMETSYFNFAMKENKEKLFNTSFTNIIITSFFFTFIILAFSTKIAEMLDIPHQRIMIQWMAGILMIDTLSALPYAKLRQEERPRKFAAIKMAAVFIQFILMVVIYHWWLPYLHENPDGFLHDIYNGNDLLYFLITNFIASTCAFLMLFNEYKNFRPRLDTAMTKRILAYSLPLVLIGIIGMSNESLGRIVFTKMLDFSQDRISEMRGVLLTVYKLAMLISVFTQMFRIAAEPFFFSKSADKNAAQTYAQSLIMYMIISSLAFILVVFFKDIWLSVFTGKMREQYYEGLHILPILAFTLIGTGMYYTMTVWYKLTDNNLKGAAISLIGLIVNIGLLVALVARWPYMGVATAALVSTLVMIIVSYKWGQKYYPIPYNIPKIVGNFVVLIVLYLGLYTWQDHIDSSISRFFVGILALLLYSLYVMWMENALSSRLPIIGKYFRNKNLTK